MANRKEKLDQAIASIHNRWGARAIGRSPQQISTSIPFIATGFPALDAAVGIGGIPRGRISELMGAPTSGMTSLTLTIIAQAQAEGGTAVYLDLERTFDPAFARQSGVMLDRLALVHPHSTGQALDMLPDMAHNGGFTLMICDMPVWVQEEEIVGRQLASALGRLLAPISKGDMTLLFLSILRSGRSASNGDVSGYPRQAVLPHYATLRLLLQRERWLYSGRDVAGYETRVTVIKNKLSAAGKQARIAIAIDEEARGAAP